MATGIRAYEAPGQRFELALAINVDPDDAENTGTIADSINTPLSQIRNATEGNPKVLTLDSGAWVVTIWSYADGSPRGQVAYTIEENGNLRYTGDFAVEDWEDQPTGTLIVDVYFD